MFLEGSICSLKVLCVPKTHKSGILSTSIICSQKVIKSALNAFCGFPPKGTKSSLGHSLKGPQIVGVGFSKAALPENTTGLATAAGPRAVRKHVLLNSGIVDGMGCRLGLWGTDRKQVWGCSESLAPIVELPPFALQQKTNAENTKN